MRAVSTVDARETFDCCPGCSIVGNATSVDERLDDVLARLPFNQRAAVVLRFYGGHTTDEIAQALECANGSVGPWIDRALDKMRKALI